MVSFFKKKNSNRNSVAITGSSSSIGKYSSQNDFNDFIVKSTDAYVDPATLAILKSSNGIPMPGNMLGGGSRDSINSRDGASPRGGYANNNSSSDESRNSKSGGAGGAGGRARPPRSHRESVAYTDKDIFPFGVRRELKGIMLMGEGNEDVIRRARTYISPQGELHFTVEDLEQYMLPLGFDDSHPEQLCDGVIYAMASHGFESDNESELDWDAESAGADPADVSGLSSWVPKSPEQYSANATEVPPTPDGAVHPQLEHANMMTIRAPSEARVVINVMEHQRLHQEKLRLQQELQVQKQQAADQKLAAEQMASESSSEDDRSAGPSTYVRHAMDDDLSKDDLDTEAIDLRTEDISKIDSIHLRTVDYNGDDADSQATDDSFSDYMNDYNYFSGGTAKRKSKNLSAAASMRSKSAGSNVAGATTGKNGASLKRRKSAKKIATVAEDNDDTSSYDSESISDDDYKLLSVRGGYKIEVDIDANEDDEAASQADDEDEDEPEHSYNLDDFKSIRKPSIINYFNPEPVAVMHTTIEVKNDNEAIELHDNFMVEMADKERLEVERKERLRMEKERLTEAAEAVRREAIAQRLERERVEKERLEQLRIENERLEKERQRVEKERLEKERLAKLEQDRLEAIRLENERVARVERERLEAIRLEKERIEHERLQREIKERERIENERLEKERAEIERQRLAREKWENENRQFIEFQSKPSKPPIQFNDLDQNDNSLLESLSAIIDSPLSNQLVKEQIKIQPPTMLKKESSWGNMRNIPLQSNSSIDDIFDSILTTSKERRNTIVSTPDELKRGIELERLKQAAADKERERLVTVERERVERAQEQSASLERAAAAVERAAGLEREKQQRLAEERAANLEREKERLAELESEKKRLLDVQNERARQQQAEFERQSEMQAQADRETEMMRQLEAKAEQESLEEVERERMREQQFIELIMEKEREKKAEEERERIREAEREHELRIKHEIEQLHEMDQNTNDLVQFDIGDDVMAKIKMLKEDDSDDDDSSSELDSLSDDDGIQEYQNPTKVINVAPPSPDSSESYSPETSEEEDYLGANINLEEEAEYAHKPKPRRSRAKSRAASTPLSP
eukprot:gene16665-19804_t